MNGSNIRLRCGVVVLTAVVYAFIGCSGGGASYEVKSPPGTTTTFVLVRHAEKQNQDIGSPLNAAGRERAQALVETVAPLGVTAIYCTRLKRNIETVEPLSAHLGIELQTLEKGTPLNTGALADRFIRESLTQHGGGVILWVGNSSSLGDWASNLQQIYLRLGGKGQGPRLYDDYFVMTLSDQGATQVRRLKYGAPVE